MSNSPGTPQGTFFNVQEATGVEQVRHETTAAEAQINAPNSAVAREVEHNAEQAQDAAKDAANAAKGFHAGAHHPTDHTGHSATAQLHNDLSQKTESAVAQGQHDVEAAKATGQGYLDQARAMAGNVLATGHTYLPEALGGQAQPSKYLPAASEVAGAVQTGAAAALGVAQQAAVTAQAVIQPAVVAGAQKAAEYLPASIQPAGSTTTGTTVTETPASSTGIPAATIPATGIPATSIPATHVPMQTGGQSVEALYVAPGAVTSPETHARV